MNCRGGEAFRFSVTFNPEGAVSGFYLMGKVED